jgi:hypothetical protein
MATLTGAVIIALGDMNTGVWATIRNWLTKSSNAAKKSGENFWQLAARQRIQQSIKSDIADIKNIGRRTQSRNDYRRGFYSGIRRKREMGASRHRRNRLVGRRETASGERSDGMKIHEYQGKELLKNYGVPVPRGIVARTPEEAEARRAN